MVSLRGPEAQQGEWKPAVLVGKPQTPFHQLLLPWKLYSPKKRKKNRKLQQGVVHGIPTIILGKYTSASNDS